VHNEQVLQLNWWIWDLPCICWYVFCLHCSSLPNSFIVLHPGLKTQYFKDNKWLQSWQDKVIAITWKIFDNEYKLSGLPDDSPNSSVGTQPSNTVSGPSIVISLLICCTEYYLPFCNACPNGRQIFSDQQTAWQACRMAVSITCANRRSTSLVVGKLKALPSSLMHGSWCPYNSW